MSTVEWIMLGLGVLIASTYFALFGTIVIYLFTFAYFRGKLMSRDV